MAPQCPSMASRPAVPVVSRRKQICEFGVWGVGGGGGGGGWGRCGTSHLTRRGPRTLKKLIALAASARAFRRRHTLTWK